jgi:UDP-glucuronate 4-epimerase
MRILVTGAAGFIGFHLTRRLLRDGHVVTAIDGFTPYYDERLKRARFAALREDGPFDGRDMMLEDAAGLSALVAESRPEVVFHLAAQAGVRYSIDQPRSYVSSNIEGTFNLLEALRATPARHLLIASTSSIYGANPPPFREADRTDHPLSFYAATKKATEDMAHSYAYLFGQPTTALRFFTVYGSWYRPDMALYKFTRNILSGTPIDLYNNGRMRRDFTYVDDVVESVIRLMDLPPHPNGDAGSSPRAPYRAVNVAGGAPVDLKDYVAALETALGRRARINALPMQPGDMQETQADTTLLATLTGFLPATPLAQGIDAFARWYLAYHA